MEARILRPLAALGVPGTALGVFCLLLRQLGSILAPSTPRQVQASAVLYMLIAARSVGDICTVGVRSEKSRYRFSTFPRGFNIGRKLRAVNGTLY